MKFSNTSSGFVLLLSALIVTSAVIAIGVAIGLSNISIKKNVLSTDLGSKNFITAEACIEEGIYRFTNNVGYTGGNIILNDRSCVITISTIAPLTYKITGNASNNDYTRRMEAVVQLIGNNYVVTSLREVK